jgi:hypothetical protein
MPNVPDWQDPLANRSDIADAKARLEQREVRRTLNQPPTVRSLDDVKKLIKEKLSTESYPAKSQVNLDGTTLEVSSEGTCLRDVIYQVMTTLNERKRLNAVDRVPVVINGQDVAPATVTPQLSRHWIDPIIEQTLSAKRDDVEIVWTIGNYEYRYDVIQNKLVKTNAKTPSVA